MNNNLEDNNEGVQSILPSMGDVNENTQSLITPVDNNVMDNAAVNNTVDDLPTLDESMLNSYTTEGLTQSSTSNNVINSEVEVNNQNEIPSQQESSINLNDKNNNLNEINLTQPTNEVQNNNSNVQQNVNENGTVTQPMNIEQNNVLNQAMEPVVVNQTEVSQPVSENQNQVMAQPVDNSRNSVAAQPVNNANAITNQPVDTNQNVTPGVVPNPNAIPNVEENKRPKISEEELLVSFIGNNYEKITTKKFNFAAFFFTTFYLFYRKRVLAGLLFMIANILITNYITNYYYIVLGLAVALGFFFNKKYVEYAKKKVRSIKYTNFKESPEELKKMCAKKGGTSVGRVFLGFLFNIIILIAMIFLGVVSSISTILKGLSENDSGFDLSENTTNGTLIENVKVNGYGCVGSICTLSVGNESYSYNSNSFKILNIFNDYDEYVSLNLYYTQKDNTKTIVGYKLFLKSNGEDITNEIKSENDLRDKLGLYTAGIHTETLTFEEISFGDEYGFIDKNGTKLNMNYENAPSNLNLVEGKEYNITFEVAKKYFGYEYFIKSIN